MKLILSVLAILMALLAGRAFAREATPAPVEVEQALAGALAVALPGAGARLEVTSYRQAGNVSCAVTEARVERPVEGSGRYPVKVSGRGCQGWAWAEVKVHASVLVTTRAVRAGESLQGAVAEQEREVRPGRQPAASVTGAKAARPLSRGQLVENDHVERAGLPAGTPVKVLVRAGGLNVTQSGRVVACGRGKTCAVMPSGKHLEGQVVDGQLIVEAP